MNEQDVRALVREAVERHLGRLEPLQGVRGEGQRATPTASTREVYPLPLAPHPSHVFLSVLPGSEVDDGMCVIEPRVRCNHCGYCQTYGH
jgi:hypothetical protein